MKIYFVRHGEASHLEEDWYKVKISRKEYIKKMIEWEHVDLTEQGRAQAANAVQKLPNNYKYIYSSPLQRTRQTAELLNVFDKKIQCVHDLKEIVTTPPKIFMFNRLSIYTWIWICIIFSLLNGHVFRIIKKTRKLYKILLNKNEDMVVVSHAMRIRSFVFYAHFMPGLKVTAKDFSTCGVSVVETKNKKILIRQI